MSFHLLQDVITSDKISPCLGQGNPKSGQASVGVCFALEPGAAQRLGGYVYENVAGTLRANMGDNQMSVAYSIENHPSDSRVNIDESGKVQTLTSRIGTFPPPVPMVMESVVGLDVYNQQMTGDIAKTLTRGNSDTDHIPCVAIDRSAYNQGINAMYNIGIDENGIDFSHIAKGPGAVCCLETFHCTTEAELYQPLKARDYKDPLTICYCLQGNQVDRAETSVCNGSGWKEGSSYTLNTMDRHAVAYEKRKDGLAQFSVNGLRYIVRRLTPLECERLQGFPDRWTDIGDYIDSKGKKKKSSDSARYKALGNSIALPPWKWVIKRISAQYERDATLASLFDGIGGFPLLWEQINGKGSCLWASEIEEFPIAVTMKRIR